MPSSVTSALGILQQEGAIPLAKQSFFFIARQSPRARQILFDRSRRQLRERMDAEGQELGDILDTVLDVKPGYPPYQVYTMQLREEIRGLATLVKNESPQSVLEIGTAKGGSFYIWSRYLENVTGLVSLDLPGGQFGGGYDERMTELFREFAPSKEMQFVRKDSHQPDTYEKVADVTDGDIDFLFLDGDHTYEGVKQDFQMYRELVSDGGIIALHDIAPHPDDRAVVDARREKVDDIEERHLSWRKSHKDCNVDQFWTELKEEYVTEEFISHPKQTWGGIGVVRV